MNRRETVIKAFAKEETKPIPFHLELTGEALKQLIDYTGDPEIESQFKSYIHYKQYWGWPTELPDKPGFFKDEFGVVWNRSGVDKDIGVIDLPIIPELETSQYEFPKCDTARLRRDIEEVIATGEDKFTAFGFGFLMFERSWSLMGLENVLMDMIAAPDELKAFYGQICDYMLDLVDIALEYDELDGIYFGDDWGQQKGLIMGPAHWRDFIKPQMARLYDRVKAKGKYVLQHSCGDCHEIIPDLIEIGLDCYQTFQPEVYNIEEMKALYGSELSFWGGISTQQCLATATRERLIAEVQRVSKIMRKNGGYILAPTHAIAQDAPPENIITMIEIFQNQDEFLNL